MTLGLTKRRESVNTVDAASLRLGDYFSVLESRNVYRVRFIHSINQFIEGELVCRHTDDAGSVVTLDFIRGVIRIDTTLAAAHVSHVGWVGDPVGNM